MKKYLITVVLLATSVFFLLGVEYFWCNRSGFVHEEELEKVNKAEAKKIMIVAHPDDEMLWGGMHLIEDDYFVICITNGNNEVRSAEFKKILEETGNEGIILSYPDKVFGRRSEWDKVYDGIKEDMEKILEEKDWELVVTHNPDGEYGHQHHIMISTIITELCEEKNITDKLFYFGNYVKKAQIDSVKVEYDENLISEKKKILKLYQSQSTTVEKLQHMIPFEYWISYKNWSK